MKNINIRKILLLILVIAAVVICFYIIALLPKLIGNKQDDLLLEQTYTSNREIVESFIELEQVDFDCSFGEAITIWSNYDIKQEISPDNVSTNYNEAYIKNSIIKPYVQNLYSIDTLIMSEFEFSSFDSSLFFVYSDVMNKGALIWNIVIFPPTALWQITVQIDDSTGNIILIDFDILSGNFSEYPIVLDSFYNAYTFEPNLLHDSIYIQIVDSFPTAYFDIPTYYSYNVDDSVYRPTYCIDYFHNLELNGEDVSLIMSCSLDYYGFTIEYSIV